jgi:hypothetical protein
VSHANAALTPRARLKMARLIIDQGWTQTTAATMFMCSPRTAGKWAHTSMNFSRSRPDSAGPVGVPGQDPRCLISDALPTPDRS